MTEDERNLLLSLRTAGGEMRLDDLLGNGESLESMVKNQTCIDLEEQGFIACTPDGDEIVTLTEKGLSVSL